MNLKNIRDIGWWTALVIWVGSIVKVNSLWMLIFYILAGVLLFIGRLKIVYDNKIQHSEDLIKDFQNQKVVFNTFLINGLKLEVKPYSNEIIEHLDAYKDIKENIEKRDIYIKLHNEELKVFYSDLKDDLINYIIQQQEQHLLRDFNKNKEQIELDILGVILNNYYTLMSLSFYIDSHDNNSYFLKSYYNSSIWGVNDNKKDLEDIGKEITKKFDNAITRKFKFKLLLCYYNEIKAYQTDIDKKLNRIIDEIRTGIIPLKGKCTKYSKEDSFGWYVWAVYIQIITIKQKVVTLWHYINK